MSNDLEKKIIKTIKETHLSPKPRWRFFLRNKFIWALGGVSLIIGAASVSVVLYLLNNNNLALHKLAGESFLAWLLLSLPYFWLIFLALFIWLLYYNIKRTSKGYRYYPATIIALAIVMSIFLGSIFSSLGWGKRIDSVLGEKAPLYDVILNPQVEMWSRPHQGRLSGLVISFQDDYRFIISDRDKVEWQILHQKQGGGVITLGQVVRLLGHVSGDNEFTAEEIAPMHPGRNFFLRPRSERQPSRLHMMEELEDCSLVVNSFNNKEIIRMIEDSLTSNQARVKELMAEDVNILRALSCLGLSQDFLLQFLP